MKVPFPCPAKPSYVILNNSSSATSKRAPHNFAKASRRAPQGKSCEGNQVMTDKIAVKRGSGNVFADLGLDHPEEEKLKAELVRKIRDIIKRRRLTQHKAATLLGLKQPDVSALSTGRVHKFSRERLLRCVRRLDQDVAIVVRPKRVRGPAPPRRPRVAA
jgi:predicted XRE-type DNA-binding protein